MLLFFYKFYLFFDISFTTKRNFQQWFVFFCIFLISFFLYILINNIFIFLVFRLGIIGIYPFKFIFFLLFYYHNLCLLKSISGLTLASLLVLILISIFLPSFAIQLIHFFIVLPIKYSDIFFNERIQL